MSDNTAPLYRVRVLPEGANRDPEVDPVFDALVHMEADERAALDRQLYRLMGEDYIGDYTIDDVHALPNVPYENVLDHVVLDLGFDSETEAEVRAFIKAGKVT